MKPIIRAVIICYLFFYLSSVLIMSIAIAGMEPCVGSFGFIVFTLLALIMFAYYLSAKSEKDKSEESVSDEVSCDIQEPIEHI